MSVLSDFTIKYSNTISTRKLKLMNTQNANYNFKITTLIEYKNNKL